MERSVGARVDLSGGVLTSSKHPPGGESFNGLVGNRSDHRNALGWTGSPASVAGRLYHGRTLLRRLLDAGIVQSHFRTKNIKFSFAVHHRKNVSHPSRTAQEAPERDTRLWLTFSRQIDSSRARVSKASLSRLYTSGDPTESALDSVIDQDDHT